MNFVIMDLQVTLFVWYNLSLVILFIMSLLFWKYYHVFEFRDKLILNYLGLIFGLGMFVFLYFDYPSSNSFWLVILPFSILYGIYRLRRLYQTKGLPLNMIRDKIALKLLNICSITAIVIYFSFSGTFNILIILLLLLFPLKESYYVWKLYKLKEVDGTAATEI